MYILILNYERSNKKIDFLLDFVVISKILSFQLKCLFYYIKLYIFREHHFVSPFSGIPTGVTFDINLINGHTNYTRYM